MNKETVWIASLYLRLSKEDKRLLNAESISIDTQRLVSTEYANKNSIIIGNEYVDDGETGVFFERPAFQRMMKDVYDGKSNCVIVKDLSRLGRDDVESNRYYQDVFIGGNIRFIAVDDGVDTFLNGYQQIATFKNMFNAMYPRDISEKTRAAYRTKSKKGWFLGSKAPYGYNLDPDDKHHLVINEETAPVVKHIFDLVLQGYGRRKIAKILREEKIPTPAAYAKSQGITRYNDIVNHKEYMWCDVTIGDMIENEIYIGNMVNHRKEKPFKSKRFRDVPKDEWIIVKDTHEPIISKEVFEEAQKLIHIRRRENRRTGTVQIFSGLVKCRDCGHAMVYSSDTQSYICSTYNFWGKKECPSHYIRYDDLYGVVLADIYCKTQILENDRDALYQAALKCNENKIKAETKENQVKLKKSNKRIEELNTLIQKTYENSVLGNLSNEIMVSLLQNYENERTELRKVVKTIQEELEIYERNRDNAFDFIKLIEKYIGIQELTAPILNELIQKIEIGEKYEHQGQTFQDIHIHYKFEHTDTFCSTNAFAMQAAKNVLPVPTSPQRTKPVLADKASDHLST